MGESSPLTANKMSAPDKFPLFHNVLFRLAELGFNIPQLLKSVGISPTVLTEPQAALNTADYFAFWQAVEKVNHDPLLAFKLLDGNNQAGNEFILLAMLHSGTFKEALQRLARYKAMVCPQSVILHETSDNIRILSQWQYSQQPEPHIITDMFFGAVQHILDRSLPNAPKPKRIELQRPRLFADYSDYFGCEIQLNCRENALIYAKSDLNLPLAHSNPELMLLFGESNTPTLTTDLISQIKQEIRQCLNGEKPTIEQVAKQLFITPRTLQRRLKAEGISFAKLLEAVRIESAETLLTKADITIGEIAFYLGYQDIHSFSRAFKKWTGKSPMLWRKERKYA